MKDVKRLIYDSFDYLDLIDQPEDLFPEMDEEELKNLSDDQIWDAAIHEDEANLDSEVMSLSSIKGDYFVAMGEIIFWNGSARGFKTLKAKNLGDAMLETMQVFSGDNHFVVLVNNKGDVEIRQTGHDNPTNPSVVVIRSVKTELIREDKFCSAEDALYGASDRAIARRTEKYGNHVCRLYGWKEVA